MRTIEFYRTSADACPVEDFLDSLTGKQAQKVLWVLRLIEEMDIVPRQYFRKLVDTEDLWEVRVHFGNDISRLLGFLEQGALLILAHGFAKKAQKTPLQDIAVATQRGREHFLRKERS